MQISAIVAAAGRGTRMGASIAKAFLELRGVPMVAYCLRTLASAPELTSVVLVVGEEQRQRAADMLQAFGPWPLPIRLADGGAERQDSVAAGLAAVDAGVELVLVHDAARPFVSLACINACIAAARSTGAAIVAVPATDTVKVVADDSAVVQTLDRRNIWLAQTPQVFRCSMLHAAYDQAQRDGYVGTDDAALVERIGGTVRVVAGEPANRKITTREDLRWAEWFLETGSPFGSLA